jgi:hypothetical protein
MEVAMWEWIVGLAVGVVLIALLLAYFDLFDIAEFFAAILKLVTGAIALLGALLVWSARKLAGKPEMPAPQDRAPAPRGNRTIARSKRPGPPGV